LIEEFDRFQAESGAAFESDYRSIREVVLADLAGAHLAATGVIERAQSGDYAEWPTWLPLAVDLLSRLPDEEPLHDASTALRRAWVPQTSPMVTAQAVRLRALMAARGGRTTRAVSRWHDAVQIVSRAGMAFEEAALRLELFEHAPEHDGALAGLHTAIATFTHLRATPWLERARTALQAEGGRHSGLPPRVM
jgi:hypothetical protein